MMTPTRINTSPKVKLALPVGCRVGDSMMIMTIIMIIRILMILVNALPVGLFGVGANVGDSVGKGFVGAVVGS